MDSLSKGTVLVVRFGALGDLVLTSGSLNSLRNALPHAQIVLVTKPSLRPIAEMISVIDDVVTLELGESALSLAQRLSKLYPNAEALIDFHNNLRSRALRIALSLIDAAPRFTVVWKKRDSTWQLPVRLGITRYHATQTITSRYHQCIEKLVGIQLAHKEPRLLVPQPLAQEAAKNLAEEGLSGRLALLSPGARWPTKRWPIENFATVAKFLVDAGWRIGVIGDQSEQGLAKRIVQEVPAAVDLTEIASLAMLPAILAQADLAITNDSGPLHISMAVETKTIGIFTCTDPGNFDFAGHHAIAARVPCAPCHYYGRQRCPRGHACCLTNITPDEVLAQIYNPLSARADTSTTCE